VLTTTPTRIAAVAAGLLLVLWLPHVSTAQPAGVDIPRVHTAPSLDSVSPTDRPGPGSVSGFIQREPRDGEPVSRDTVAYLSYDADRLYVVFVCAEDPARVRARLSRRESIDADDSVSVYLDTFHDRRRAYVFTANPLGVQADRVLTEGQDADDAFDTVWDSEGRVTPFGYVVKIAIPFRSLRFSPADRQTWGLALSRHIPRLSENAFWPRVSRREQGLVPQFADATGLRAVSPGANVQIAPYGAATVTPPITSDGAAARAGRAGFDLKTGLGSAFVLDAAVNPDFSEVETDDPQVTLNERFEVLFPEKRPFFLENAAFFDAPIPVFFSRRIRDPQGGLRVSGKAAGWTGAGLVMRDRATAAATEATALVGVVRRDVGEESHVGSIVAVRDGSGRRNVVASVDGRWTIGSHWAVLGQGVVTGDATVRGRGLLGEISRRSSHVETRWRMTDLDAPFAADLGFIRRVDIRQLDHESAYRWRPRAGPVVKFGPRLDGFAVWSQAGDRLDWRLRPRFEVEFVGDTAVLVDRSTSIERLGGRDFDKVRSTMEFDTRRSRTWALAADYEWGTDINRRPAAGQTPALVDRRSAHVGLTITPGRHLLLSNTLLATVLRTLGDRQPVVADYVWRGKAHLQMTRALSVRATVDLDRRIASAVRSATRSGDTLGVDVLAAYDVSPGSAVFVGYVDRYEGDGVESVTGGLRDVRPVGRQLFVKMSWLVRF
jgi:hypothetical protein